MIPLPDWPRACGGPFVRGILRATAEDFIVEEESGLTPSGKGPYLWLKIRKSHTNTDWLARELARQTGLHPRDVGYAGLKDRHALTTQWFSLFDPDYSIDINRIQIKNTEMLEVDRHHDRLQRGSLHGNFFTIKINEIKSFPDNLDEVLERIQNQGVPNYFAEQRFGHEASNLLAARALFAGTLKENDQHLRGLYLSAARSFLFNQVLATRIRGGNWQKLLPGDVLRLAGTDSLVECTRLSERIAARLAVGELHLTGPLWGRGSSLAAADVLELETAALQEFADLQQGLAAQGMQQERRNLCLRPERMRWEVEKNQQRLQLSFFLPAGCFATSIVREIADYTFPVASG